MADIVNIIPLNPNNFEFQEYSDDDNLLISSYDIETKFNPSTDLIEYFIYNLNNSLIYQNNFGYNNYQLIDNILSLNPEKDLKDLGYEEGEYNVCYNFNSPILGSNPNNKYFISEISPDRTEIRIDTTQILNEVVISSSISLSNDITNSTGSYYDFYVDFGSNKLVIANNVLLDQTIIDNPTILIKLYEALPAEFGIKSELWVVTKIAESVAYNINIVPVFPFNVNNIQLKGPNTNISIKDQINNSTDYNDHNQLSSTDSLLGSGSLKYQLDNLLVKNNININIDYSDYSNFIHFSSGQTRLENFYYKLSLLEEYTYSASLSDNTSTNYYVSSSNIIYQNKINEIITGLDNYEYHLYYNSGSTSWPKSNTQPPYQNVITTSSIGQNWLISQSSVAQNYDSNNNDALINTIPDYLRNNDDNSQFELFVEMIGQHFDNTFLYTSDITNKYDSDNRLDYGISKDLIADILRDLGIKIYQNNFSSNDLYSALLGITPSGSLYNLPYTTDTLPTPTGYEHIDTYITASLTSSIQPTDDINKSIYKRIYNNLPYLLKKKGTIDGLRNIITLYGIPDTILRISEFGGQNKNNINDYDYFYNEYNYCLDTKGTAYITSSFSLESDWNSLNNVPQSVEFRFKTRGIPTDTGYYSQSLWSINNGSQESALILKYTGSGFTTSSYSGSIPNPENQYALLEYYPDITQTTITASLYLPFYDGEWWSVMLRNDLEVDTDYIIAENSDFIITEDGDYIDTITLNSEFLLTAKNKNYKGYDGNFIGFQSSSSINYSSSMWNSATTSYFGTSSMSSKIFSGSFQEIRYYKTYQIQSIFDEHVMNPNSIKTNTSFSTPDELVFRASLGGELYTSSISIHPKITGSWGITQSFSDLTSNFVIVNDYSYIPNKEIIYPNPFPNGIKNRISNKIFEQDIILPYSSSNVNIPDNKTLSPFRNIQQESYLSGSYTPNVNELEVTFSPQNEINDDITNQLGFFNIGDYIGDPRLVSSSQEIYPSLVELSDYYFQKYKNNYNIWDYIRLIKYFDNSLFKMIKDWIPARTSLSSGITIKQHTLERNKYPVPQFNITSSLAKVSSGSNSISWDVEDITITGSAIQMYSISSSTGGTMPDLLGLTSSLYTGNNVVNINQVWTGSTPSLLGLVDFSQSNQEEFYNGELSGSIIRVEDGELNNSNIIKYPSKTLLLFNSTGSSTNFLPSVGSFTWNWQTIYNGSSFITKVGSITINKISNNGVDIQTTLSNLKPGNSITFPISASWNYPTSASNQIDTTLSGIISNISSTTNGIYNIIFSDTEPATFITTQAFDLTVTGSVKTNLPIYINPYIDNIPNFQNSEYNPLINNVLVGRPNNKYLDVDFDYGNITAVNANTIINATRNTGSATPSTVPDSNYTSYKSINSRYLGSKNTSNNINEYNGNTPPSIEQLGIYALAYNKSGKSDYFYPQTTTYFNIEFMFDENGDVYYPQESSSYYWNGINLFGKDNLINISIQNSQSISQSINTQLQNTRTSYAAFEYINSKLMTASGSNFNNWSFDSTTTGSIQAFNSELYVNIIGPYFATSSVLSNVITCSMDSGKLGSYFNNESDPYSQFSVGTQGTARYGFNPPIEPITPIAGDLFYISSSLYEHRIISTSIDVPGNNFLIHLDRAPSFTNSTDLNKFVLARKYINLNRVMLNINLSGSNVEVGSGFIFPKQISTKFKDNLINITKDFTQKGLI